MEKEKINRIKPVLQKTTLFYSSLLRYWCKRHTHYTFLYNEPLKIMSTISQFKEKWALKSPVREPHPDKCILLCHIINNPEYTTSINQSTQKILNQSTVACFLSSRTDLLCSPRIAAGEALCLVTHLVSYRGSKNCTQIKTKLHLQLGVLKEGVPDGQTSHAQ